jgi:hypothetical protein
MNERDQGMLKHVGQGPAERPENAPVILSRLASALGEIVQDFFEGLGRTRKEAPRNGASPQVLFKRIYQAARATET